MENNKSTFKLIIQSIPWVVLTFTALVLLGVTEFATASFDFSNLLEDNFLFTSLINVVCGIIGLTSMLNLTVAKIQNNTNEQSLEIDKYNKFITTFSYNAKYQELEEYVKNKNFELKKIAWKKKLEKKIMKLTAKITEKNYANEKKNGSDKLISKIKKLEVKTTDEFINEKLLFLKVKYTPLRINFFFNIKTKSKKTNKKISPVQFYSENVLPSFLLSMTGVALLSSFIYDIKEFTTISFINISIKLISYLLNVLKGHSLAKQYVNDVTIGNLKIINKEISLFQNWNEKKEVV